MGPCPSRALLRTFGGGLGLLILNSAYLAGSASPTVFFYANVALHVALGLAIAIAIVAVLLRRFGRVSRAVHAWCAVLLAATLIGVWLSVIGATVGHQRVLYAHAGLAALGVAMLAGWLGAWGMGQRWHATRNMAMVGVVLLAGVLVAPVVAKVRANGHWRKDYS